MSRTGENIFKRKDGRWEARYIKGYDMNGKSLYGYCYGKTYKEAKEKAAGKKAEIKLGLPPSQPPGRHRFCFYCDQWLKSKAFTTKESTYSKYDSIVQKHILPSFGGCDPQHITRQQLEVYARKLLDQGLSAKTVRDILTVLLAILKSISRQYPGLSAAMELTLPKEERREMRVLSEEEQLCLIKFLSEDVDSCKAGVLLALMTGMRIGELCALQWKNVSLENRTIQITATMQRIKNSDGSSDAKTKIICSSPKSMKSLRTIPLTDRAAALCQAIDPANREAYVLTGCEEWMEPRALQYRFAGYTAACGLKDVHFHTIRHTFATRCVEVGFDIKSLSEILGHSSTTVTLDRYVHSSISFKRDNMKKLSHFGL